MERFSIIDSPAQRFGVVINSRRCTFILKYNFMIKRWSFDLLIDTIPVLYGRRIVMGVDLIKHFSLGIGRIFAADYEGKGAPADYDGLVSGRIRLYHISEEEIAALGLT